MQKQKLEKTGIFRKKFYGLKVIFQTETNILSIEIVSTNRKRLGKSGVPKRFIRGKIISSS